MRDAQRQKVYNAEEKAAKALGIKDFTFEAIAEWCRGLTSDDRFRREYPTVAKHLRITKPAATARKSYAYQPAFLIALQSGHWNSGIALHEIAHLCMYEKHGMADIQDHGWQFCEIEIQLFEWFLGTRAAITLEEHFTAGKVKWKAPVKREISPEHRAKLQANAAKAREAREAARGYRTHKTKGDFRYVNRYGWEPYPYEITCEVGHETMLTSKARTLAEARKEATLMAERYASALDDVRIEIEAEDSYDSRCREVWLVEKLLDTDPEKE